MTTSASRGSVSETFLRLCSRAPRTTIWLLGCHLGHCTEANRRSFRPRALPARPMPDPPRRQRRDAVLLRRSARPSTTLVAGTGLFAAAAGPAATRGGGGARRVRRRAAAGAGPDVACGTAFLARRLRGERRPSTRARAWPRSPAGACPRPASSRRRGRCRSPTATSSASSAATSTATCSRRARALPRRGAPRRPRRDPDRQRPPRGHGRRAVADAARSATARAHRVYKRFFEPARAGRRDRRRGAAGESLVRRCRRMRNRRAACRFRPHFRLPSATRHRRRRSDRR